MTCSNRFEKMMDWLAEVYVNAMNIIHYMHDKYAYERDRDGACTTMRRCEPWPLAWPVCRWSLTASRRCATRRCKSIRDDTGLVTDYKTEGEFPQFGNNDNRVDHLAAWVVSTFMNKLRKYPTYRNALHTQSILTITSNVVYGKSTGNTPDGRRQGEPFAPGANPMHGRDSHGIHASGGFGCQDSLSRRRRWHFIDDDFGTGRPRQSAPKIGLSICAACSTRSSALPVFT